ncbi:hypothetical protein SDC9_177150 [bioreactor metagenome]|uniref:Uncharacterized protein n=1 Tax=bioreactor metagenome TaxID=1076179 RepID=A0A645GS23_9ZZZZ
MSRPKSPTLGELLQAMEVKTRALMVEEIARAREYLGSPLTPKECEAYLKQSGTDMTAEMQQLAATVELRQKTEASEFMRRAIERAERRDIALDEPE